MPSIKQHIGFLKSKLIYNAKPFAIRRITQFYSEFIEDGSLCFDIGAHTGNRSKAMLNNGAKVIALEPQVFFANYLREKFKKNGNFTLLEAGVSAENGIAILKTSSLFPTISTLSSSWENLIKSKLSDEVYDQEVEIKTITLNQLIADYGVPSFCKIDIEGHEYEVIKTLNTAIPCVSFEFFTDDFSNSLLSIEHLNSLAKYQYNFVMGEKTKFSNDKWMDAIELTSALKNLKKGVSGDIYAKKIVS